MAKKNNYLIYGDDDREQVENIDEIAKGLDELINKEREKEIKKRLKKKGKKKTATKNNVNYVTPVKEDLLDINDDVSTPDVAESTTKAEDKKEAKETSEKKKTNWGIWVLTACLAIIAASIGTVLYNRFKTPTLPSEPVATEVTVVDEQPSQITGGRLVAYNPIDGEDVNASLVAASNINAVIESYYRDIIDVAKNYKEGESLTSKVADYKQLVQLDTDSLETYKDLFTAHDGSSYFEVSKQRLGNVSSMLDSYTDGVDKSTLYTVANNFIRKENSLSAEARQALIYYLDRNNIYYNDDSQNVITYEELSISGDSSELNLESHSEGLEIADSEEPIETAEPSEEEVPENTVKPEVWIYRDKVWANKDSNYDVKINVMSVKDDVDGKLPYSEKMDEKGTYSIETDLDLSTPGEYTAHLKATDSSGNAEEDDWIIVVK